MSAMKDVSLNMLTGTFIAALVSGSLPAAATTHVATTPSVGCLDHSVLLSRAAYRPDSIMPSAICGHLLSTEVVVKPRTSKRT